MSCRLQGENIIIRHSNYNINQLINYNINKENIVIAATGEEAYTRILHNNTDLSKQ